MEASANDNAETVVMLIENGADVDAKNYVRSEILIVFFLTFL